MTRSERARRLGLAILAVSLLVALTIAIWAFALGAGMPLRGFELSVEAVEAEILSWGMWGVAAAILLMVLHSFVPFPAEVVAMANGMLYGPLWGTLITWVGAMLGAYLAFGLARWLGRPFVGLGNYAEAFGDPPMVPGPAESSRACWPGRVPARSATARCRL